MVFAPGGDDNASGTAGVLEIARAFAALPTRKTIVFIAFDSEEQGVVGSTAYAGDAFLAGMDIILMLNMDMISRNDTNEVAIIGSKSSTALKEINAACNETIGMEFKYTDRYFLQSDHYPFYRNEIPVLFYHSQTTSDLHKPTDDVEKIIPEKMSKIGRLLFLTAWTVANRTERPDYVNFR